MPKGVGSGGARGIARERLRSLGKLRGGGRGYRDWHGVPRGQWLQEKVRPRRREDGPSGGELCVRGGQPMVERLSIRGEFWHRSQAGSVLGTWRGSQLPAHAIEQMR